MGLSEPLDDDLLAFLGYVDPPCYELLVDPCVALDVLGLWMTMRVVHETEEGPRVDELDVHLPVDQTVSEVELGHQNEVHGRLGAFAQDRVLAAARKALSSPLLLVVELNGSPHGVGPMLEDSGQPKLWAVDALGKLVGSSRHEMVNTVLAFQVPAPQPMYLQVLARVFFGEPWTRLFETR